MPLAPILASLLPLTAAFAAPPDAAVEAAIAALVERHGQAETDRARRGVEQLAAAWRTEDGDVEAFRAFAETEFLPRGELLDATFDRFELALERIDGYFLSMSRDLRRGADLEIGPMLPLDERLAAFNPGAHLSEDLFASRLAFVALLNFPLTTLDERLGEGDQWSRRTWAEVRLAARFSDRLPGDVTQEISGAFATADSYINGYNIRMDHLLTPEGDRLFPDGLRLISHWGLRDELKARYADPEGIARQRMIKTVFDRIVRQEIPAVVIDNPEVDWVPETNEVRGTPKPSSAREADERYRQWLSIFHAVRRADPYSPDAPTFVARRFERDREIPEAEVEALFRSILGSPLSARVAAVVAERLGRPLEPFDIWYNGLGGRGDRPEAELDRATRARYPDAAAFKADIPRILTELGFTPERARFVADRVVVEPSRGAGHAFGAGRRDDNAHLRTRVGPEGMDYKGYNIAVHELGHNVEQVLSLSAIDHTLLSGVPNTGFTEALAFVFQARDLELLGLANPSDEAERLRVLHDFWDAREIAGVALVDMLAWRWLYEHPEATPAELREAVLRLARTVWNEYDADLLGARDETLLCVYSHMVDGGMYTPDYPLGQLIAFQIETHFATTEEPFGAEFERMARLGRLTPDLWMRQAVGQPLSAAPLLEATASALDQLAPER